MKLIIDRFEGGYAVCEKEDGGMLNIKRDEIPLSAKEGDVLEGASGKLTVNQEETENRRRRIEEQVNRLYGDS